jgi:hypothetical protein
LKTTAKSKTHKRFRIGRPIFALAAGASDKMEMAAFYEEANA